MPHKQGDESQSTTRVSNHDDEPAFGTRLNASHSIAQNQATIVDNNNEIVRNPRWCENYDCGGVL